MFDMGFAELLLIAVIALVVIGPRRMPEAVRVIGYWLGKFRRTVHNARREMEREFGLDDIRRDLHNESLLAQLEKERRQIEDKFTDEQKSTENSAEPSLDDKDAKTEETVPDKVVPEDEQEMLQAFEDFEKEFGIEPDGSERPNDEPTNKEASRKDTDQAPDTTSRAN